MVLLDDKHSCGTIIAENIYLSSNNDMESRDPVLSYLHNGGVKYRIYSSKIGAATNINIKKMTEMIESNTTLEVSDDAGENQLLIGLKCTVVVVQPGYPILNKPHSMRRVFCQNKA